MDAVDALRRGRCVRCAVVPVNVDKSRVVRTLRGRRAHEERDRGEKNRGHSDAVGRDEEAGFGTKADWMYLLRRAFLFERQVGLNVLLKRQALLKRFVCPGHMFSILCQVPEDAGVG